MINKVGRFCLAKGVKFVWLFQAVEVVFDTPPLWLAKVMIFCAILFVFMFICFNVFLYSCLHVYLSTCINVYKGKCMIYKHLPMSPNS